MNDSTKHRVLLDYRGYADAGGGTINQCGYLWIGDEETCYTHTTSLRSIRALRDLCDKLIKARERKTRPRKRRAVSEPAESSK